MLDLLHNQDDLDAIKRSLQSSELCEQLLCRISTRGVPDVQAVTLWLRMLDHGCQILGVCRRLVWQLRLGTGPLHALFNPVAIAC